MLDLTKWDEVDRVSFERSRGGYEAQKLSAARRVTPTAYGEMPVCVPAWWDGPSGPGESGEWWPSVAALLEACTEAHQDPPPYAWGCSLTPFTMSARSLLEDALEGHHEGASDEISTDARTELQALLDAWCAKQKVQTWEHDFSTVVVLLEGAV
jgi:hypothetical protein